MTDHDQIAAEVDQAHTAWLTARSNVEEARAALAEGIRCAIADDVFTAADAARILGWSRQRLHEFLNR
jgi:hypothetical protein